MKLARHQRPTEDRRWEAAEAEEHPRRRCTQLEGEDPRLGRAAPTTPRRGGPRERGRAQMIVVMQGGRHLETASSEAAPELEHPSWRRGCNAQGRRGPSGMRREVARHREEANPVPQKGWRRCAGGSAPSPPLGHAIELGIMLTCHRTQAARPMETERGMDARARLVHLRQLKTIKCTYTRRA